MQRTLFYAGLLLLLPLAFARAQFIEDGLRLVDNPLMINARSLGMGNAFTGVADDFSAIYFNPGGLALIRRPEFSFGLTSVSTSNDATYLGSTTNGTNSNILLNNIGFVLPFPVLRGSMVFAVGYNRVNDFTGQMSFSAFNGANSLIPKLYNKNSDADLAWNLGLEDTTGATPLQKDLTQQGKVTESGGLNQWAFSGSVEVMQNLSIGATVGIVTGSYRWDRQYSEIDTRNLYQDLIAGREDAVDFREFRLDESMMQDYSGWNATLGMMYNYEDRARVGLAVKTPSFVGVKENFSGTGRSWFANASYRVDGDPTLNPELLSYSDYEYDIRTPWIFSLGVSGTPVDFLTLAGSVDAIDYTQMEFSGAANRSDELVLNDLNDQIRSSLRSTLNYHLGLEATVPHTGLQVRGGFQLRKSPFKDDPSDYDTKTLSIGLGYLFESTFQVNATWVHSSYSTFQTQLFSAVTSYEGLGDEYKFRTDEKRTSTGVMLSIAYRF